MVKILREADKSPVSEVAKKHGVSDVTIYAWRKRFGQLEAVDVKRLRALEAENARLNGAGNLVEAIRATGFSAPQFAKRRPFDLVLANILANPLRQMATPMARHLTPSALVILSGLLPHQAQSVIAAYRARGLVLLRELRIEGWSSLLLRRAE